MCCLGIGLGYRLGCVMADRKGELISFLDKSVVKCDDDLLELLAQWLVANASVLDIFGSKHDVYEAADNLNDAAGVE